MNTSLKARPLLLVVLAALVAAFALAGCGPTKPGDTAAFNDADVTFVTGMIGHHQQAVVMSDWAAERGSDPKVQALAKRITAAQGPEIRTMTAWLKAWDQPVPDAYNPDAEHGGHAMEGMDMGSEGMMSADDMATLETAKGADFDQEFLRQMVKQHEGAVSMSKDELKSGENPKAKVLAKAIIAAQTAEIAEMKGLLAEKFIE
jgi:uncharacterized protein (DUF305 family)